MGTDGINGIRYRRDDSASSFLLDDSALFSATSYKVLRNQDSARFIPCVKSLYNGRVKLTYFTEGYAPLSLFLETASDRSIAAFLENLVESICEVERNGFLQIRNIVLNADIVFVRANTNEAGIVYVPVTVPLSGATDLEAAQALYRFCSAVASRTQLPARELAAACDSAAYENGNLNRLLECVQSMGAMSPAMQSGVPVGTAPAPVPIASRPNENNARAVNSGSFMIKQIGRSDAPVLRVTRPETLMGKSPEKSDFAVGSSSAVSRVHCCLLLSSDGSLRVADRGSTNGTFVDGRKLAPGEEAPLVNGTRLRLADVEFAVSREG